MEAAQRQHELRAGRRMRLDLRALLRRQRPGLQEHLRPHLDLADVVERRRGAKRADALAIPAEPQRDRLRERRDAGAVTELAVALFERA